ncbi:MAG: Hsp20/alpha crystallin family protein, partial [Thermoproteota archaeon]
DKFVLTADIPGMEKDEVDINVLNSDIEISAEHKEAKEEKEKDFIRKERSHVRYYRSLTLPEETVSSKVTAKMINGILTIELPKKNPTKVEEPAQIKVQ